jgi:hypothetical protein
VRNGWNSIGRCWAEGIARHRDLTLGVGLSDLRGHFGELVPGLGRRGIPCALQQLLVVDEQIGADLGRNAPEFAADRRSLHGLGFVFAFDEIDDVGRRRVEHTVGCELNAPDAVGVVDVGERPLMREVRIVCRKSRNVACW